MLNRGGGRSNAKILEYLADPQEGIKQLAEQAAKAEAEREKLDAAVKAHGGIAKIEAAEAEAEKRLEAAKAEAARITADASRATAGQRRDLDNRENALGEGNAALTRQKLEHERQSATTRAELDQTAKTLAGEREAAQEAERVAAGKTAAADAKMTQAEDLLGRLKQAQTAIGGLLKQFNEG